LRIVDHQVHLGVLDAHRSRVGFAQPPRFDPRGAESAVRNCDSNVGILGLDDCHDEFHVSPTRAATPHFSANSSAVTPSKQCQRGSLRATRGTHPTRA
jgi:hypothetical protein